MDLIFGKSQRDTLVFLINSEFKHDFLSRNEIVQLVTMGIIHHVNLKNILASDKDFELLVSEITGLAKCLILHFSEKETRHSDVRRLMEWTNKIYDEMVPYVNKHAKEIVSDYNEEYLVSYLRYNVIDNNEYDHILPYEEFIDASLRKLSSISVERLYGIPSAVSLIPDGRLKDFFDTMTEYSVVSSLNYDVLSPEILRYLYIEKNIIPYNRGLLDEESIDFMVSVVEDFMNEPGIDFSDYIDSSILVDRRIQEVIKKNLCKHISKSSIRESLLYDSTYDELVCELGIIVHACVGIKEEYIEYAYPRTRLSNLTDRELKVVLDNVHLYADELRLKKDIYECVKDNVFAWKYNADACLYVSEQQHHELEEDYLKAIRLCSGTLRTRFKFITFKMVDAILKRNLLRLLIHNFVNPSRIEIYLPDILRIQDICVIEYDDYLFEKEYVQDAYVNKFCKHPLFISMVLSSEIPEYDKLRMLRTLPKGVFPLTRLENAIFSTAYEWKPSNLELEYAEPETIVEIANKNINVYETQVVPLDDGTVLQTGTFVVNKIKLCSYAKKISPSGMISIQETDHRLVNVVVGDRKAPGILYTPTPCSRLQTEEEIILSIVRDLLVLLRGGIVYNLMSYMPEYDKIAEIDVKTVVPQTIKFFRWYNYYTLEDKLITFSKLFNHCNQYLTRAYVYAHHLYQYLLYAINYWMKCIKYGELDSYLMSLIKLFLSLDDVEVYIDQKTIRLVSEELRSLYDGKDVETDETQNFLDRIVSVVVSIKMPYYK